MIEGISHITFVVRDLEKATCFWQTVFDAEEVYASGDDTHSVAREKFFVVGNLWIAIMEGTPRLDKSYDHIAFKITDEQYDDYAQQIKTAGVETIPSRSRIEGEGRSLYFYDYDNHLFEIHTGTLDERLNKYNAAG